MIFAGLLALHLFGLVGYTLILRKSALSEINKRVLATLMQTAIFLPTIPLVLLEGSLRFDFELWQWASLAVSGVFVMGLHITTIKALQNLEASIFTIIFNLRLFITTLLGFIFLNEVLSGLQLLGGLVIFLSILTLNLHKNNQWRSKPVMYGLAATVWFSVHATIEKFNVLEVGFSNFMFWAMGIATILLWLWVWQDKTVSLKTLAPAIKDRSIILLASLRTLSAWGYTYSLQFGALAIVNYVSGLGVVLIVLFGIILLKERSQLWQKLVAAGIAAIGLSLILISNV